MGKATDFLPRERGPSGATGYHLDAPEFAKRFPAINALLSIATVNGEARQGATITLFAEDGALKCAVSDRHTDQSLFLTLDPSADVLSQVESYIVGHSRDWRAKRQPESNGRRKG